MTKIKVFGTPRSEIIRILEESLWKLDLNIPEIYLAFAKNEEQIKKYRERFGRISMAQVSKEEGKRFLDLMIKMESRAAVAALFSKTRRKENLPPVILVNLSSEIPEINWEDCIFHETLHLKDEVMGWMKIEESASFRASEDFCIEIKDLQVLCMIFNCITDFFGYEIASQYGFEDYVLRNKRTFIANTLEDFERPPEQEKIKLITSESVGVISLAIYCAFTINLPPSYKERERDQKILEKEISPIVSYFPEYIDYQGLTSLPAKIKVPPEERNLLRIYGRIFEIYNDFLNHFL